MNLNNRIPQPNWRLLIKGAVVYDTQWLQNPNFPIRAVFGPTDFKSAVLFFGSTYSENKKCSEITLYLILR